MPWLKQLIETLQNLLSSVTSAHHISPACRTVVNSGSAGPTDKMSLLTLEHLRLSCEPLVTNRTLGYSPGDVGGDGSAHQAQDVQVSHRPHRLQGRSPSLWCLETEPSQRSESRETTARSQQSASSKQRQPGQRSDGERCIAGTREGWGGSEQHGELVLTLSGSQDTTYTG